MATQTLYVRYLAGSTVNVTLVAEDLSAPLVSGAGMTANETYPEVFALVREGVTDAGAFYARFTDGSGELLPVSGWYYLADETGTYWLEGRRAPAADSGPDAATIAAAVWAHATASITTTGSIGKRLLDLFTGITSLAQWLGLMAGKQAANSTALTEIRATGAGSGTYDPETDSPEALTDGLPAAVKTAMEGDGSKLDHLWETTEDNEGTRRFTEAALAEAPTGGGGGGATAEEIADAVDAQLSGTHGTGSWETNPAAMRAVRLIVGTQEVSP